LSKTPNTSSNKERYIFHKTGADTNGEYIEMEVSYPPNSTQPPYHYHPFQEETFEVLQGTFRTKIGDLEHTYETGGKFRVHQNTPHCMHNISGDLGCLLWQVHPAMKTQAFFETMWGLEADGKINESGVPNLLQLDVILHEYSDEFRASNPPYWIQRILFGLLSPIGKLLGYRASYSKYSSNAERGTIDSISKSTLPYPNIPDRVE
jgi:quercetin dioxygenase-like cupin family protein